MLFNDRLNALSKKKKNVSLKDVRIGRRGRTIKQTVMSTGILIAAIIAAVFVLKYFNTDMTFIAILAVFVLGIMFTIRIVRKNPTNKADVKDEHETCMPILDKYAEKQNLQQLMRDYKKWWEGEHSNYTRMHFAEKIIDILIDKKRYETALRVLYQVAELPLKGRDHYDFDNYLQKMDPYLRKHMEEQQKIKDKQLAKKNK